MTDEIKGLITRLEHDIINVSKSHWPHENAKNDRILELQRQIRIHQKWLLVAI